MRNEKKGDAVACMSRSLERANRFIIHELEDRGIFGIVPSHGDILHILFVHGKVPMQEIAKKIHRTKPTVTILVKKLVEMGYIQKEKCLEDNRITYISLTDQGRALHPVFHEISQKLQERVYGGFTPEQAVLFEEMLGIVFTRFNQNQKEDDEDLAEGLKNPF